MQSNFFYLFTFISVNSNYKCHFRFVHNESDRANVVLVGQVSLRINNGFTRAQCVGVSFSHPIMLCQAQACMDAQ